MVVYSIFTVKINSIKASAARERDMFLLPLITNRKTSDREIWGSFKVHVHIFVFSRSAHCLVSVRNWLILLPLSGCSPIKSGGAGGS